MARQTKSRAEAKKIKDRWRAKKWYTVVAPEMFDRAQLGETLADDPKKLMGRVMEVTLHDLTGDYSKMHLKLYFKIIRASTNEAFTKFIGHDTTTDYIRRLTRRKRTKMDAVYKVTTKDGYILRVKPLVITEHRIQTSKQHAIRRIMEEVVKKSSEESTFSEFVKKMLSGEISAKIAKAAKPIYPLKRVEIRKSEVLFEPLVEEKKPSTAEELPEEVLEGTLGEGVVEEGEAQEGERSPVETEA